MGLFSGIWDSLKGLFGGASGEYTGVAGSRLYVGNLSYKTSEDELRSHFSKSGRIKNLHLIRDKFTRRLKGYAFVEMSPEDAKKALSMNGTELLGRKLVVSIAKSRNSSQGSGGGGSERGGHRRPSSSGGRWQQRKRRSGPRVYGQKDGTDPTPVQRLE